MSRPASPADLVAAARAAGIGDERVLEAISVASDRTRSPFGPVPPRTRRSLIELAAARDLLIMRWAG